MSDDKRTTTAVVLGVIAGFFLKAWLVMLALGGLHHEVSSEIPAPSYGGTLLVLIFVGLVVGFVRR